MSEGPRRSKKDLVSESLDRLVKQLSQPQAFQAGYISIESKVSSFDCLLLAYESLSKYEFGEQINEFQMRNSWNPLKHCSVIQSGKGGQSWTV